MKTKELGDGWIRSSEEWISSAAMRQSSAKVLPKNTVLMAMYGATVGRLGILARDAACNQAACAMIVDPLQADYRFLFYRLLHDRDALTGLANGAAQQNLSGAVIKQFEFPCPPLDEQRRIARVLGAFDDLVELNRLHIEHLMALSSALYSLVRRRATKTLTFGDVAEVRGGGTPSTRNPAYWGGPFAWATPTDVTRLLSPYLFRTDRTLTPEGLDACASRLYPVGSILMTSRATIGALALNQVPVATNQGFLVVLPRADSDRYVLFHEMLARVSDFKAHANGSTFLELSRGRFKELLLPWPDNAQREAFHARVAPLHEMACALEIENADLRRTRDELLPLLMSGAVRVSEVEDSVP